MKDFFAGIDIGASSTKAVIIDAEKKVLGYSIKKTGTDFQKIASLCLGEAIESAKISKDEIKRIVSTGYGRKNIDFSHSAITEISCHAKGCFHYFPEAITIIDIGGQDNKIIKLNSQGKRISFKMNRKCAAGTGAFLEEMSLRLDIPLEEMDSLARRSTEMVQLGSYCTVFTATEVLEKLKQGKAVPDIVKGLFLSVIKRVLEMDTLTDNVVMTGGVVAHNSYIVEMTEEMVGRDILVPPMPQLSGAFGAALFALDME
ncbi:MAG TPA: ATPase [Desulfobacteraceae bacterium]|nr:ATPase [Desulfobacteraceae bacterium]